MQREIAQEIVAVGQANSSRSISRRHVRGLRWRITGTLVGLTVIFGLFVLLSVGRMLVQTLRAQLNRQSLAVARNLSDAAAGYVIGRNLLHLNALVAKYALLDGVAYVFIEDQQGKILARSPRDVSDAFGQTVASGEQSQPDQRVLNFRGESVSETSVPILNGQAGSVHVGVWEDAMWRQIERALVPLSVLIAVIVALGAIASVFLARGIIRPILRLSRIAENMSRGDLDSAIPVEFVGEIGDLAYSLERMRTSLKAAMVRLSRERALRHAGQTLEEKSEPVA